MLKKKKGHFRGHFRVILQRTASAHHASGPAVHHLRQAELELADELLGCLRYPTIPLQVSNALGDCQHLMNALNIQKK